MSLTITRRRALVTVAFAICAICIVGYAVDLNGGSLDFSDTEAMIVASGSMDGEPRDYGIPTIPTGSLVLIHPIHDYSSVSVGDVLTFDYDHPISKEHMVVTHRVVSIFEANGIYTFTLQGDSVADDPTNGSVQYVTSDSGDIHGEVVGVSHFLGSLVQFLSTWTGRFVLILIPCIILIASEVRSIFRTLKEGDGESADEPVPSAGDGRQDTRIVRRGERRWRWRRSRRSA